jgi:nucleoside-diphosphate-sugar epimerase
MKVCVIGGTGNISSGIVSALLADGHDVTAFVRGNRIDELPGEVTRLRGDRADRASFVAAIRAGGFDAVIDMICFDAEGADATLAAAADAGHLVVCSTVATRVDMPTWPSPEDALAAPRGAYGVNKVAMEDALMAAHREHGTPVTIMRPSYTYGRIPLLRQIGFDSSLPDRMRKGWPVLVVDNAWEARWQCLHVDDAGVAFAGVLGRPETFGEVYNVVGSWSLTWADFHLAMARGLGLPEPELVGAPLDVIGRIGGAGAQGCVEITGHPGWYTSDKIRAVVPAFDAHISFEDGIARNLAWLEQNGGVPEATRTWEDDVIAAVRQR